MMVVMAVMAEALHLDLKVTKRGGFVKSRIEWRSPALRA
jgi:hypothetical protein